MWRRFESSLRNQSHSQEEPVETLQHFVDRATEVGARVSGPMTPDEATRQVVELFLAARARTALLSPDLNGLREPIAEALVRAGAKLVEDPAPEAAAQADAGVSTAVLAVAETGSVVVAGNDLLPRLATMLPLVHIVLVEQRSLVSSLDEAGDFLRRLTAGEGMPPARNVSIITGPSRTADIEKTLSVGVHGPRDLHIVLIQRYR